mmetsp:Transcript_18991/g.72515  ORF Transcript_18991/g.72515 Transcript_18991/m.72515 type:complete len:598 (+) Transcript_18991:755-2548(+)
MAALRAIVRRRACSWLAMRSHCVVGKGSSINRRQPAELQSWSVRTQPGRARARSQNDPCKAWLSRSLLKQAFTRRERLTRRQRGDIPAAGMPSLRADLAGSPHVPLCRRPRHSTLSAECRAALTAALPIGLLMTMRAPASLNRFSSSGVPVTPTKNTRPRARTSGSEAAASTSPGPSIRGMLQSENTTTRGGTVTGATAPTSARMPRVLLLELDDAAGSALRPAACPAAPESATPWLANGLLEASAAASGVKPLGEAEATTDCALPALASKKPSPAPTSWPPVASNTSLCWAEVVAGAESPVAARDSMSGWLCPRLTGWARSAGGDPAIGGPWPTATGVPSPSPAAGSTAAASSADSFVERSEPRSDTPCIAPLWGVMDAASTTREKCGVTSASDPRAVARLLGSGVPLGMADGGLGPLAGDLAATARPEPPAPARPGRLWVDSERVSSDSAAAPSASATVPTTPGSLPPAKKRRCLLDSRWNLVASSRHSRCSACKASTPSAASSTRMPWRRSRRQSPRRCEASSSTTRQQHPEAMAAEAACAPPAAVAIPGAWGCADDVRRVQWPGADVGCLGSCLIRNPPCLPTASMGGRLRWV